MPIAHPFRTEAEKIQALIDQSNGDSEAFVNRLHHSGITHISFSQVYSFETCPRQYYLRYVIGMEITPVPENFIKGKALHRTIANAYRANMERRALDENIICYDDIHPRSQAGNHLRNGYLTLRQNMQSSDKVIGIEKPFVYLMDERTPPVVGVIDLILRRGEKLVLIDHKTGRDFYKPDILQMAVYLNYLRSTGFDGECEFYYDSYRWVENLARIRKPAFSRQQMTISQTDAALQAQRLADGYAGIKRLRGGGLPDKTGDCFRCAYRNNCWY
jgi:CRISPR/Cas system-associated exonuclease Cas4 (RecB family)